MNIQDDIRIIGNLVKRKINKEYENLDLTCSQAKILTFILINKDKEINQRDLEKHFNLTNPTINGILNRLENKGFIKRVCNNKDRRVKNIIPLKRAIEFEKIVKTKLEDLEKNILQNIKEEEMNIFNNVLNKIINNLKESLDERNI